MLANDTTSEIFIYRCKHGVCVCVCHTTFCVLTLWHNRRQLGIGMMVVKVVVILCSSILPSFPPVTARSPLRGGGQQGWGGAAGVRGGQQWGGRAGKDRAGEGFHSVRRSHVPTSWNRCHWSRYQKHEF
jgi:hypothetical protein